MNTSAEAHAAGRSQLVQHHSEDACGSNLPDAAKQTAEVGFTASTETSIRISPLLAPWSTISLPQTPNFDGPPPLRLSSSTNTRPLYHHQNQFVPHNYRNTSSSKNHLRKEQPPACGI